VQGTPQPSSTAFNRTATQSGALSHRVTRRSRIPARFQPEEFELTACILREYVFRKGCGAGLDPRSRGGCKKRLKPLWRGRNAILPELVRRSKLIN